MMFYVINTRRPWKDIYLFHAANTWSIIRTVFTALTLPGSSHHKFIGHMTDKQYIHNSLCTLKTYSSTAHMTMA